MGTMLSTLDNPYNPLDENEFSDWYKYDMDHNYDTCSLLARIAPGEMDSLPDSYTDFLREDAINRIVKLMPNIYWKVSEDLSKEQFTEIVKKNKKVFDSFKSKAENS